MAAPWPVRAHDRRQQLTMQIRAPSDGLTGNVWFCAARASARIKTLTGESFWWSPHAWTYTATPTALPRRRRARDTHFDRQKTKPEAESEIAQSCKTVPRGHGGLNLQERLRRGPEPPRPHRSPQSLDRRDEEVRDLARRGGRILHIAPAK